MEWDSVHIDSRHIQQYADLRHHSPPLYDCNVVGQLVYVRSVYGQAVVAEWVPYKLETMICHMVSCLRYAVYDL